MHTKMILSLMQRISNAYMIRCGKVLDEYDLVPPSFHILMFLAEHPEQQTAKDISAKIKLKANVISFHVERLVNEGYLTRQTMSDDRRKVRLVLTDKAMPVIESGREMNENFCDALKQGISEENMDILGSILTTIGENADQIVKKGTNNGLC